MFIPFCKQERLGRKTRASNTSVPIATERSEISEPSVPSSSSAKLSAPLFIKKVKSSDRVKFGKQTTNGDKITANLEDCKAKEVKDADKHGGASHGNPFLKSSNKEEVKKAGEVTGLQPHRPSNPFLKSTVK